MYWFPKVMLNPGELVTGHQKLKNNCFACHQAFNGINQEKCISCHALSKIGSDSMLDPKAPQKILFHDKLSNNTCTACHSDHLGMNPEKTFNSFKHELLLGEDRSNCNNCHSKPTDKLHNQLSANCNNCHKTEGWKLVEKFNHNQIEAANKNNCTACHTKPTDTFHQQSKDNCNTCHSTEKWVPSTFEHSRYFVLDGKHQTKCVTCHTNNDYSKYTCYGCHEHSESNIRGEHNEEGIYQFNDCVRCHKSGSEHGNEGNGNGENGRREGSNEENED
jgi:hypothetical protein